MFDNRKKYSATYDRELSFRLSDARLEKCKKGVYSKHPESSFNSRFLSAQYIIACADANINWGQYSEFRYYYSFLVFQVVSYTPAVIEYPLFGKAKFTPPVLMVKDQGGTVFNMLEHHRIKFRDESCFDGNTPLNGADADGSIITLSDRVFKLIDTNNILPDCIPGYRGASDVNILICNKMEAAEKLHLWKSNIETIKSRVRADYERQKAEDIKNKAEQQARNTATRRKLDDLDNMFR